MRVERRTHAVRLQHAAAFHHSTADLVDRLDLKQPLNGIARSHEEAQRVA